MAKFIKSGDTIEGDSVGISARKCESGAMVSLPSVKKIMYRYSLSRNSNAVVKKSHTVSEDPEIIAATSDYHRDIGDELECFSMKLYVDCNRKIKFSHEGGVTHTHGANIATTNKHSIATISTPLQSLLKVIGEKENKEHLLNKELDIIHNR